MGEQARTQTSNKRPLREALVSHGAGIDKKSESRHDRASESELEGGERTNPRTVVNPGRCNG